MVEKSQEIKSGDEDMSLKTLEDMDCVHCNDKCDGFKCDAYTIHESHAVSAEVLKLEAIKHLKQDNIQELFLSGRTDILPSYRRMIGQGMKKWIKHFFNIEESEL